MARIRRKGEGVANIVRFNWHFYALSGLLVVTLLITTALVPPFFQFIPLLAAVAAFGVTAVSLAVSWYVYDYSGLYRMEWLQLLKLPASPTVVNIHSGFDETSQLLQAHLAPAKMEVCDFYDLALHTEVSIKLARKAYPPFPGTQTVTTKHLPCSSEAFNVVFTILAAHEVRATEERIAFFAEMRRLLVDSGCIVVVEHLRDTANFLAYNIGFLHFHSRATWLKTFSSAGFTRITEHKLTPFISIFILYKNGTAH